MPKRIAKTKQIKVLQGNYGYGWNDLCYYEIDDTFHVVADYVAYRENEPDYAHRVITRRVANPDYVEEE